MSAAHAGAPLVWRPGMPTLAAVAAAPEPQKVAPPVLVAVDPEPDAVEPEAPPESRPRPDPVLAYLRRSFASPLGGGCVYRQGERLVYTGRLAAVAAPEEVTVEDIENALPGRGAWVVE